MLCSVGGLFVVQSQYLSNHCCMRFAASRSGLLSKASIRLRQAMQRESSAPQVQQLELSGHSGSSISTEGSEHSTAQQGAMAGPVAALLQRDSSGSLSGADRLGVLLL